MAAGATRAEDSAPRPHGGQAPIRRRRSCLVLSGRDPKIRPAAQPCMALAEQTRAYWSLTSAEDARFELARGCPQHAFQVCGSVFTVGRRRPRPAAARPRVAG
jgi:hypothetical protein